MEKFYKFFMRKLSVLQKPIDPLTEVESFQLFPISCTGLEKLSPRTLKAETV